MCWIVFVFHAINVCLAVCHSNGLGYLYCMLIDHPSCVVVFTLEWGGVLLRLSVRVCSVVILLTYSCAGQSNNTQTDTH